MSTHNLGSPWWPGDVGLLSDAELLERRDRVGRLTLEALHQCNPIALEQGTIGGEPIELLELHGTAAAHADLRDAWNSWCEVHEEISTRERRRVDGDRSVPTTAMQSGRTVGGA